MELILVTVSICFATLVYGSLTDISVPTKVGTINGLTDDAVEFQKSIKAVSRFLGIPFAKPPVGDRRFRRPEVLETLQSPHNATYHRPYCPQLASAGNDVVKHFKTDEDCLYLNIYVPGSELNVDNQYPVMIWIPGGSFVHGGANTYSGDLLSAFHDVIVVTFNYRVGPFGFLTDGSENSGNIGLWDQKMVIQWVHDNIDSFGGDTSRVTLFGESAGSACVLYQALHVENKGKVHRIIAQSGSVLASWVLDSETSAKIKFKSFAERMNCSKSSSELTIECLQGKSADDIVSTSEPSGAFLPIVDMDFMKESPAGIFANKTDHANEALRQFGSFDFLSGVNSKEGASIVQGNYGNALKAVLGIDINDGVPKQFFDSSFVSNVQSLNSDYNSTAFVKAFLHEYTDWSNPNDMLIVREKMVEVTSDFYFFVPAIKTVISHSILNSAKRYFYVFDHKSSFHPYPSWIKGATHFLEIPYVLGLPASMDVHFIHPLTGVANDAEKKLSALIMKMWTNFAKNGTPTTESMQQPTWPVYSSDTQQYLTLSTNMTSLSVQQRFAATRVAFWTNLVPALKNCSTTITAQVDYNDTSSACVITLNFIIPFISIMCMYWYQLTDTI